MINNDCLDQIAIPDFSAGAMENWGLITYRETRLLEDPNFTSSYDLWRFTKTISHEFLHQVRFGAGWEAELQCYWEVEERVYLKHNISFLILNCLVIFSGWAIL